MKTSNLLPEECREEIREGYIAVDSEVGKRFGFTSDKFRPHISWLWKTDGAIWLSMIWVTAPNRGYTQGLISSVRASGHVVKVPTPLGAMRIIVKKMGFAETEENTDAGPCRVWVLGEGEDGTE